MLHPADFVHLRQGHVSCCDSHRRECAYLGGSSTWQLVPVAPPPPSPPHRADSWCKMSAAGRLKLAPPSTLVQPQKQQQQS